LVCYKKGNRGKPRKEKVFFPFFLPEKQLFQKKKRGERKKRKEKVF